jgi:hypothetical protein
MGPVAGFVFGKSEGEKCKGLGPSTMRLEDLKKGLIWLIIWLAVATLICLWTLALLYLLWQAIWWVVKA